MNPLSVRCGGRGIRIFGMLRADSVTVWARGAPRPLSGPSQGSGDPFRGVTEASVRKTRDASSAMTYVLGVLDGVALGPVEVAPPNARRGPVSGFDALSSSDGSFKSL